MNETRLCVRLPDLQATVAGLASVHDRLGDATHRVGDPGADQAGFVAPDLAAFADHWAHGVRTLHQHVGALRTALAEVHDAYAAHEADITRQLSGGAA
ncbi:MAG: hypothetical protein JWO22_244 [Frankiales bacterium]|nr:hypothetical protein [Frankiales bacterium]